MYIVNKRIISIDLHLKDFLFFEKFLRNVYDGWIGSFIKTIKCKGYVSGSGL